MEALSQSIKKTWELNDTQILEGFLADDVEYISLARPVILVGKSPVIAHLENAFTSLKNVQAITTVISDPGNDNCFRVIHTYIMLTPTLNYMITKGEIFKVISLEAREIEVNLEISYEIVGSKIDLIMVDQKNKTKRIL